MALVNLLSDDQLVKVLVEAHNLPTNIADVVGNKVKELLVGKTLHVSGTVGKVYLDLNLNLKGTV